MVGFAQHASDQRARRLDGAAYSAGVVASFAALGLLVVALRGAGQQLGWGFQLQMPGVVAALAVLFTLIGLNLTGVFEVRQLIPTRLASLQSSHPVLNSFLSGVLEMCIRDSCVDCVAEAVPVVAGPGLMKGQSPLQQGDRSECGGHRERHRGEIRPAGREPTEEHHGGCAKDQRVAAIPDDSSQEGGFFCTHLIPREI